MRCNRVVLVVLVVLPTFALSGGCLGGPADEDVGEVSAGLTPVTWTDVVGVSAAGNDLTKTAPETAFNAGAVSVQTLAGDGFVEFTTAEITADKAAGLSAGNGGQGLADIDFAIRLNASGRASIYEGGVNRGGIGTYAAGDLFRVQVDDGVVTYYRNGVLRYTSALTPSFPLLVDTSLRTPGATINDVAIEASDFWENAVGVAVDGNDITKTAPQVQWNAGATSIASIPSGDGYIEFRVEDNTRLKAAGLSSGDGGQNYTDIDFVFYLNASGGVSIYEGGVKVGNFGPYEAGDHFQVEVSGGVVTYYRRRIPLYTSLATPSFPLLLDTSLRTPGTGIFDARLVAGTPLEDCAPFQQSFFGPPGFSFYGESMFSGPDFVQVESDVYREGPTGWFLDDQLPLGARIADDGVTAIEADLFGEDSTATVYRHDGAQWVEDGILTICPGDLIDEMAVSSNRAVLGGLGKAYIYRRGSGGWILQAIVQPEGGGVGTDFGELVKVAGSRVFVSDADDDTMGSNAGAVYVFRFDSSVSAPLPTCDNQTAGKWVQEDVLFASNAAANQRFGWFSMDPNRSGTSLIVGNYEAQSASIFDLSGGQWSETALLEPSPVARWFGIAVAFGGPGPDGDSVAMVGSSLGLDVDEGRAYLFAHPGGPWQQIDYFSGPRTYFGLSVEASATSVFVGDRINDTNGVRTGAFHIHDIDLACVLE